MIFQPGQVFVTFRLNVVFFAVFFAHKIQSLKISPITFRHRNLEISQIRIWLSESVTTFSPNLHKSMKQMIHAIHSFDP